MELKHCIPVLLLLTACSREQLDDCITSTGPMRTEERVVGDFSIIDLNDRIDLVLEDRAHGSITVEAGRNLLGQVDTHVENGTLLISNDNRCNWVRSFKPRITVHAPIADLVQLTVRGTGDVTGCATIHQPVFRIDQRGAQGTMTLQVDVDSCYIGLHAGAGDVYCTGRAGVAQLYGASAGVMHAESLDAVICNAHNNGIADMHCHASQRMDGLIRFVGDIYYSGDPPEVVTTIEGDGSVIHVP